MLNKTRIGLGIDDFKELIVKNYYFVDKTLFIKEIIDLGFKVYLVLRPRRFGKTMHLSMLKYYFNITEENKNLFANTAIAKAGQDYLNYQQSHPVIFVSLKDVKAQTWEHTYALFVDLIADEYTSHSYLLDSDKLSLEQKEQFTEIAKRKASIDKIEKSLKFLSELLEKHHNKKVYILIDEYDTPIHDAFYSGYVSTLLAFMRNFLGKALKGNLSLEQGVVTGILRIAKESLFSGINNFITCSVLDNELSDYFSWNTQEVAQLLSKFQLTEHQPNLKKWYDGYHCGIKQHLYNPWSVLNFVGRKDRNFRTYWANTANPGFLRQILAKSSEQVKVELEKLLIDETLLQPIDENLTLLDFEQAGSLWTLLLFSGYLTAHHHGALPEETKWPLSIPNFEVKQALKRIIESWFTGNGNDGVLARILHELTTGNLENFRLMFTDYVEGVLSYFDVNGREPERFYHALVLGMLVTLKDTHTILSNRESGYGRYDVMLIPNNKNQLGIIIEFKKVSKSQNITLKQAAAQAFKQIEEKKYQQTLQSKGIKNIMSIAMVFSGKAVLVTDKSP